MFSGRGIYAVCIFGYILLEQNCGLFPFSSMWQLYCLFSLGEKCRVPFVYGGAQDRVGVRISGKDETWLSQETKTGSSLFKQCMLHSEHLRTRQ